MTYNVFGGTLSLTQSIKALNSTGKLWVQLMALPLSYSDPKQDVRTPSSIICYWPKYSGYLWLER